ncbi:Anaphase spindle elongation 1-like protein [Cladobotryum mycophilum]|uniref:Anaphase spindle elongation 1-like protein n=1 Tax=Cladobotryum mycophilum TaxID=491253 RepID=A0ABR0SZR0_9HYPO
MDTSYLAQQVNNSIGQLHGLFDEIGVPSHERESRESELFTALSEALNNHLRMVTTEKKEMIDEAKKIITAIKQMEASLEDSKHRRDFSGEEELKITYPLIRCLQALREKHSHIAKLHKERFEQVMKLVEALESYSSHLEPTFVKIALPPLGPNRSIPLTFDLSPSYVDRLDTEFTRVYEEYTRRIAAVQALGDNIIQLWAELGIPQVQQDAAIVRYYRDAPEQLGLHEDDLNRLTSKRDKLREEKRNREKRLHDLRTAVEALWEKLGIDEDETKVFMNQNRGCGIRQINEFEDELQRLTELKHQNLHLFVEDARVKLQELWDALYFCEDEMLEFLPAFSEVYTDALLETHEVEIERLEALREQRAPILTLVDKHKGLIKDRDELIASSQDSSRLMLRGQKGEKRDPGKLLREEKMRKRIAKELPKVTTEVKKVLEEWEDEYGIPFLVFGERYLDEIEMDEDATKKPGTTRTKTPNGPVSASRAPRSAPTKTNPPPKSVPPRTLTKTPTTAGPTTKRTQSQQAQSAGAGTMKASGSPSRIPARVPLANLKNGPNSPDRPKQQQQQQPMLRNGAPMRAPPPKMRDLKSVPELDAPANPYKSAGLDSTIVRAIQPEDVYDDRPQAVKATRSTSNLSHNTQSSCYDESYVDHYSSTRSAPKFAQAPRLRQVSDTSYASTTVTGSENWETYDDNSELEADVSEVYYAKLRAARGKRMTPEQGHRPTSNQAKRIRGIPGYAAPVMIDQDGNRIVSGSEWADEETF